MKKNQINRYRNDHNFIYFLDITHSPPRGRYLPHIHIYTHTQTFSVLYLYSIIYYTIYCSNDYTAAVYCSVNYWISQ